MRDLVEVETASFWRGDDVPAQDIGTEVFFLPAASHVEKDGNFTNTQRVLQWHAKAVDPPGECRSELWFAYHLFAKVRERLAGSTDPKDRAILDLAWDYELHGPHDEPDAAEILQEINGRKGDGSFVPTYLELKEDGSTSCGSWIHAGIYADGVNQTARKKPGSEQNWIAPEWGWAWPMNRRILYNRASADPDGNPWSERKRYVWWDTEQEKWTSLGDDPDFEPTKPPDYRAPKDATGLDAIGGTDPFIIHPDGLGWIWVASGLVDGPLPRITSRTSRWWATRSTRSSRTPPARSSSARTTPTTRRAPRSSRSS